MKVVMKKHLLTVVPAILLCTTFAQALPMGTPLWQDTAAVVGPGSMRVQGSTPFSMNSAENQRTEGYLHYAVYKTSDFRSSGGVVDWNTEYVYAYQIFNGEGSSRAINHFEISMPAANVLNIGYDSHRGRWGGVDPSSYVVNPMATTFNFAMFGGLGIGEHSTVLLIASNTMPGRSRVTLNVDGSTETVEIATPAPEPATMALLGIGMLSILRKKKN